MKLNRIFKHAVVALAAISLVGVTSCDYLDVVPPEQPGLEDAMKTHNAALGFLYSCYAGLNTNYHLPTDYTNNFCANSDEWVWPNEQEASYPAPFAHAKNTQTSSLSNVVHAWGNYYRYIGQCLLFEQQLKTLGREYEVCENAQEEEEWLAESRFLKAYYHFVLLRLYGPIPLTLERIPMDTDANDYAGRSHFDYCVQYIANEFDEAAKVLPATRDSQDIGRATSVIAKAMKARLLLLAASDLYNGKFPYPEWKNTTWTTPGYGKELISHTYDRQKWVDAYDATLEAIEEAEIVAGHGLMYDYEEEANVPLSTMEWIPVSFDDDEDNVKRDEFLRKIMLNRYIHTTSPSDNPEILWSVRTVGSLHAQHRLPLKINKNSNGQWFASGWSVFNATLNTAYGFLCMDGRLPAEQHPDIDFSPRGDWFKKMAGAQQGHEDIINLMRNREPRFYAWIAFDGGNYLNRIKNGGPLTLNFKSSDAQGFNPANEPKNLCSTGMLMMKHVNPVMTVDNNIQLQAGQNHPVVLCRLTELYLNMAEICAELANDKRAGADASYADEALTYLNTIRDRAGVPALEEDQIGDVITNPLNNAPKTMTLVEWVRQERFIELWDECQRYYDIRRWVAGPEYLGTGMRQGLTGNVANPSFETFNTPRVCNPNFTFGNRQYLYPIFINEVYKNPNMVQAPGF